MRFNQAVDRGAVERAFFFRAGSESDAIDIAGGFEWAEDGKSFTFVPDARLWYDSEYVAGFPAGTTCRLQPRRQVLELPDDPAPRHKTDEPSRRRDRNSWRRLQLELRLAHEH